MNSLDGAFHKGVLLKKIRGRISAYGQLRKNNQLGSLLGGASCVFEDLLYIPGEVPHRGVDLRQSYLHST
jgi:hypothetical protein